MLKFLKKLFGIKTKRTIRHPRELQLGDVIKFGSMPQRLLSYTEFEVSDMNSYVYEDVTLQELTLRNLAGKEVFLAVEFENGKEYLAISKRLTRADMQDIMSEADLERILADGYAENIQLLNRPADLSDWLAPVYHEDEDGERALYRDHATGQQEKLLAYLLVDEEDDYGLEIEVYGKNEMEYSAIAYHEMSAIAEMYPKGDTSQQSYQSVVQ